MSKKRKFPFRQKNDDVIWTLTDGEEIEMSWEEFKEMVKSEEFIALPRKEFETYYKRMKMPKQARIYHQESKRKIKKRKGTKSKPPQTTRKEER